MCCRRLIGQSILVAVLLCTVGTLARCEEILVSAATSLTEAFQEIGVAFQKSHPGKIVRFNFGASGALLQQIRQGAPADVFASASPKEMDTLAKESRLENNTRKEFASNRLVLIVPSKQGAVPIRQWEDLKGGGVTRIALSNPDSVPSGRYAREVLIKHGLWEALQPKAIFGENVRQTLTYVAGGNVDAGIVFATDAKIEGKRVKVVQQAIPTKDHAPILYPIAVLKSAPNGGTARQFVTFVMSQQGQAVLQRHGFVCIKPTPPPKSKPK